MAANHQAEILEAIKEFIEDDPYYSGLWRGLHIIVMEYLSENVDDGLHQEVNALFFKDFNSLLELIWSLHKLDEQRAEKVKK